MQRERLTSAIVATVFIPALGLGLTGAASARTISAAHYSERTVVINCQGRPQVQPGSLTLACADGNDYLADLNWTTWAPGLAGATGVQVENDCVPYCAAGHLHRYPVDAVFWGSAAAGPGSQRYTQVTLLYPGARPDYGSHRGPTTVTMTLPS